MRSKKALYNIIFSLLSQMVVIIYGFIIPRIILTHYGSSVNGLVSSITQFLSYIALLESGFGPVVKSILYKPIAKNDKKTIENILKTSEKFFRIISYVFIFYIFVLSIIYPLIVSKEFGYIYTISLIVIISISIFSEYFFGMTYRLYLQAKQETYVISIIQISTYLLSVFTIVLLVKFNVSIHIIKLFGGLSFVLRPILQNLYVKKKYSINLKNANKNYKIDQKWDGLAQHIAYVIHNNTDIAVLTIFCSLSEVSVYSVYFLVVTGIKNIVQAFINGIDSTFGDMIAKNEINNLNKKFNLYEVFYFSIITIVFISTMILIVPFVSVYTKGIKDVNYIRYAFGYLIVISEYIWAIRLPYSSITYSAGHFKETKKGAWIEAFVNILLSVLLVIWYGIIGAAIGTIVAMTFRTVEFVYHTNKYILKRNIWHSLKKILLIILETILFVFICGNLMFLSNFNYVNWVINAMVVSSVTGILILFFNVLFFCSEFKDIIRILKFLISKKN